MALIFKLDSVRKQVNSSRGQVIVSVDVIWTFIMRQLDSVRKQVNSFAKRRIAGLVIPWMLSRSTLR